MSQDIQDSYGAPPTTVILLGPRGVSYTGRLCKCRGLTMSRTPDSPNMARRMRAHKAIGVSGCVRGDFHDEVSVKGCRDSFEQRDGRDDSACFQA